MKKLRTGATREHTWEDTAKKAVSRAPASNRMHSSLSHADIKVPVNTAQIMVVINGLILTVIAYAILSVFIGGMLKEEYGRLSVDTVQSVGEGVIDLENTVRSMAMILSFSDVGKPNEFASQLRETVPDLGIFDQVLWLYQSKPGVWSYSNIYLRSKLANESLQTIEPDGKFIQTLLQRGYIADTKLHTISSMLNMEYLQEKDNIGAMAKPFALLRTVSENNAAKGFIIGLSRVGLLLKRRGLDMSASPIERLTIRETLSGNRIYHLDRTSRTDDFLVSAFSQEFNFTIADREWTVALSIGKQQKVFLLEFIPYLTLVFGLFMTLLGVLYVRNNYLQSYRLTAMNRVLEQKNFELESEVAERARLNDALRKAERDNRAVIDSVSDIIFETDTDGKILFLNAMWRKITGFDPEQSVGLELFTMLYPQDQDAQRKDFTALVKGQKAAYRGFTRLRTSDGTFRAVELAVSVLRQDESRNQRVVGTFTDVEERRRAERALSEAEKKYRTIVENAAGGIYQITPEGLYLSANPAMARILGYDTPEQILREVKNAHTSVYLSQSEREAFIRDLERKNMIVGYDVRMKKRDGSVIWVSENARAVRDESGHTLYYEGSIEDITQRKEADIALREAKIRSDLASRAKSEFLANMSHELRTPLNAIIGFSEIIKNEAFGPIGQKAYWEYSRDIYESGRRLLSIINEILDISRIEAGDRQLNEGIVNIEQIMTSCVDLLSSKIDAGDLRLVNELHEVPQIIGEEIAIKQALNNLLSNAIKFTPRGGSITLSAAQGAEGQLKVSVTDTGIGLDPAEIEKALSPFGQIDNELSRSGSGTGLGLTLVDSLMKLHGGSLQLVSQKGLGTTASIIFPASRVTKPKKKADTFQAGNSSPAGVISSGEEKVS